MSDKLCIPRVAHQCRLCGETVKAGEPCERWATLEEGHGYSTYHAHPECYQVTVEEKWKQYDWEVCFPGDLKRPEKVNQL